MDSIPVSHFQVGSAPIEQQFSTFPPPPSQRSYSQPEIQFQSFPMEMNQIHNSAPPQMIHQHHQASSYMSFQHLPILTQIPQLQTQYHHSATYEADSLLDSTITPGLEDPNLPLMYSSSDYVDPITPGTSNLEDEFFREIKAAQRFQNRRVGSNGSIASTGSGHWRIDGIDSSPESVKSEDSADTNLSVTFDDEKTYPAQQQFQQIVTANQIILGNGSSFLNQSQPTQTQQIQARPLAAEPHSYPHYQQAPVNTAPLQAHVPFLPSQQTSQHFSMIPLVHPVSFSYSQQAPQPNLLGNQCNDHYSLNFRDPSPPASEFSSGEEVGSYTNSSLANSGSLSYFNHNHSGIVSSSVESDGHWNINSEEMNVNAHFGPTSHPLLAPQAIHPAPYFLQPPPLNHSNSSSSSLRSFGGLTEEELAMALSKEEGEGEDTVKAKKNKKRGLLAVDETERWTIGGGFGSRRGSIISIRNGGRHSSIASLNFGIESLEMGSSNASSASSISVRSSSEPCSEFDGDVEVDEYDSEYIPISSYSSSMGSCSSGGWTLARKDDGTQKGKQRGRKGKVYNEEISIADLEANEEGRIPGAKIIRVAGQKGKSYVCLGEKDGGLCNQLFRRKEHWKRHFKLHSQEKPFSCQFCGRGSSRQDNNRDHERSCAENPQAVPRRLLVAGPKKIGRGRGRKARDSSEDDL